MKTEASLLQAIASATTFREQAQLVAELDALRAATANRVQADRDVDLTDTIIRETMTPVLVHSMHTASTDWLSEADMPSVDHNAVHAEASLWFGKTAAFVREDEEEFTEQARGFARRFASQFGEQAGEAERAFMDYVAFLHRREGASGLDQIQQLIDPNNKSKKTNLPTEVFDNFAPEIAEGNAGIDEQQSTQNAPLLNEILQKGQGTGTPEVGYQHGEYEQNVSQPYYKMPSAGHQRLTSSLIDEPSVALGYVTNLDEFRALQAEAQAKTANGDMQEALAAKEDEDEEPAKKEAASTLPQVQQLVDSFENPDPKPLPEQVAFPLLPFMQQQYTTAPDGDNPKPKQASSQAGAPEGVSNNPLLGHTLSGEDKKVEEPSNAMAKAVTHKDAALAEQEFNKGFQFAANWQPGDRLVTQGSMEFEAGLYAGISQNTAAQQAWLDAHVAQAHLDPFIAARPEMHMEFTAMRREAATTTDLDTMTPGVNVNNDRGETPIQGMGEVPPLAGRADAAAPAGAAPYNGAEPFGVPVAPDPGWVDPRKRQAAFAARVQANLQAESAEGKSPVCRGCGEAFESRAVAEEAHGKRGCGTEDGERGYEMKKNSEAW